MSYTKKEIKEMETVNLLAAFYLVAVKSTKEANSRRGVTKRTTNDEQLITDELCERLDLDKEQLQRRLQGM